MSQRDEPSLGRNPAATTRERPAAGTPPLLALTDMYKRYGGVRALRGASLLVERRGVVHALMGENGSGKSTLLGALCGSLQPDAGEMRLDGALLDHREPADALARGIALVSQETSVALDLSVAENVLLGRRLVRTRRGIDWAATRRRAAEVLGRLELDYDPRRPLRELRSDERQMVEIARALSFGAQILVLDEPTSSLTDDEVRSLFRAIDRLRENDVSVIWVSHRIDEVLEISDELTVLRDGRTVASGSRADFDGASLVHAMVGDIDLEVPEHAPKREGGSDAPILRVVGIASAPVLEDVSLEVRAGEVVGIAGLVGSGRSELLEALFGLRAVQGGHIEIAGRDAAGAPAPDLIRRGVGFLPPDRKVAALVGTMSVEDNLTMVATLESRRLARPRRRDDVFDRAARAVGLRVSSRRRPVSTLSGGNQQKVAIGKWLVDQPLLLLLDEPTRGVDVAAKAEIHGSIRAVSDRGAAVVVSSSDNRELLQVCDTIVVLSRGRNVASVPRHEADEARLTSLAGGYA
jgi:ABC-type sugar transport system ATPase subunit